MPFCPRCETEYRPNIDRCPDCGSELVDRLPEPPAARGEPVEEALLCTVRGEIHARLLMDALGSQGITARTQLGGITEAPWYLAAMPAPAGAGEDLILRVYVRADDLERARRVYEDMESGIAEQPEADEPGRPEQDLS